MLAVIKTGGKQYAVQKGDILKVEKIDIEVGQTITFDQVLLIGEGEKVTVGTPLVTGAKVTATIVEQKKDKKVTIVKHTPKKRTKKKQGHRQLVTKIEITGIAQ